MTKLQYLRSRRLRVFGRPNGSGKSTILNQIASQYDLGYYINADEIEKILSSSQEIDLSHFGIVKFKERDFEELVTSHSLVKKATKGGYTIDL